MKWIFLVGLILFTPVLILLLRNNRDHLPKAAFFLGLLPFIETRFNVSAAPISWALWPGYVRGIEFSLTDAVAIALILASGPVRSPAAVKLAFGLLFVAFLISSAVADVFIPAFFYGWQLVRVAIVYFAVARASTTNDRVPLALLTGLIIGLASQAIVVTFQYLGGDPQAGGWFGHQNLLGMATHFIVYPAFAVFLGGLYSKRAALAGAASLIIAFGGGSRATIGLLVIGLLMTAIVSCWRQMTRRKAAFATAAIIGLVAVSPLLYLAVERRSDEARAQSNEERGNMLSAASMIISDFPLGVGANQYVVVANVGGYSARAGIAPAYANLSAPVHNTYYLVTAEMGWFGLFSVIALIGAVWTTVAATLRRARSGFEADYAVGLAISFMMVAAHAYFEWITMIYQIHLLFAMNLGLLVAFRARSARKSTREPVIPKSTGPGMFSTPTRSPKAIECRDPIAPSR